MSNQTTRKLIRSYRLVFRRRWRIFRIQGWRIPLPGGIELRLLGYWLAALATLGFLTQLPIIGRLVATTPLSLRLVALPLAASWLLSRWELDGRPPHRALIGLLRWRLCPRTLAALRPVPGAGRAFAPILELHVAPDLNAPVYPHGRIEGPARLLLRYPVQARRRSRTLRLLSTRSPALHSARTLDVPAGHAVVFESPR